MVGLALIMACGCGTSTSDKTLVKSGYDQKEMDEAIAQARGNVESFIAELSKPTGEDHAVKVPIKDGDKTEHFWLSGVSYQNGEFNGTVNNDPGVVSNVKIGQKWAVKKMDISDWMFMRDGKIHGNFTMRPLIKTLPAAEAEEYRKMLADPGP